MDIKEEKINGKGAEKCGCGWCNFCSGNCSWGGGHRVIWWIIKILVVIFIFVVGIKIGEFKAEYHNGYRTHHGGNMYYMMRGMPYGGGRFLPYGGGQTPTASNPVPLQQSGAGGAQQQ